MSPLHNNRFIAFFLRYRIIAHLVMVLMLVSGIWALHRLNVQFLPNFDLNFVQVSVEWPNASAADVERSVVVPIEQDMRDIPSLSEMTSNAHLGYGVITLEFDAGTDMSLAFNRVKERMDQVRGLPQDIEPPKVTKIERYERIARVLIWGPKDLSALRPVAYAFERELLHRGIAKIDIIGLPEEELRIKIPTTTLHRLRMSLTDVANQVRRQSQDVSAGTTGKNQAAKTLRSLQQKRTVADLADTTLRADATGQQVTLSQVAEINQEPNSESKLVFYQGHPAVELLLQRTQSGDALSNARILQNWLRDVKPTLGPSLHIKTYQESWRYIYERIMLLLKNGLAGLACVLVVLYLFLDRRVAFWVALGIPVSFMATLFVMVLIGASINMVSLFAMIMTLGIIVDDTIVVSEDALHNRYQGMVAKAAVLRGASRMFVPVTAAALTTIAAFIPLMTVSGIMGQILFDIPTVVICIIVASLVECFVVLPTHLRFSFKYIDVKKRGRLRKAIDDWVDTFRRGKFKQAVEFSIRHKYSTVVVGLAVFVIALSLVFTQRVAFTFFPTPELNTLYLNADFASGTPRDKVKQFLLTAEQDLYQLDKQWQADGRIKKSVLETVTLTTNETLERDTTRDSGEHYGHLKVELTSPGDRPIDNQQIIQAWRKVIRVPAGLEQLTIESPRGGPPGKDIDIALTGAAPLQLKQAAEQLTRALRQFAGALNVSDNLPFGKEEWLFKLTPQAETQGLTVEAVSGQLKAAFAGQLVDTFTVGQDEIEVRVMLPDQERHTLQAVEHFPVILPNGASEPLTNVVSIQAQQGLEVLRHSNGELSVHVMADVDPATGNANQILSHLQETVLPELVKTYGLHYEFKGKSEEQQETLTDMLYGLFAALTLIYVILAIVFNSYGWPLLVMAMIPLGLAGAILGHWLMGYDLTILSLFGLFGLAGIVTNDSIILVKTYKDLRRQHQQRKDALVEAVILRLRQVFLTSVTTIVALLPLMFERSVQAQFLIPMAVSIVFGLALATFLILFVLPAMLAIYERV